MPVAGEYQAINDHLLHWQAWSPQSKVDLSTTGILSAAGLVLVDPIRLTEEALVELTERHGPPVQILLTSGNHERDSAWYVERFGCPVLAHPDALPELTHPAEGTLRENTEPFCSCRVIELPGAAAGEVALYLEERHSLILGDIVINLESFGFNLLPDKYATNPKQMRQSLRQLLELKVRTIAFAHGTPITSKAGQRLAGLM